jgi:hypothetical protein
MVFQPRRPQLEYYTVGTKPKRLSNLLHSHERAWRFFHCIKFHTICIKSGCCCWSVIWPPPWSSGQSSGYRSRGTGFDSWRYKIFWEVVGLERGPLSLVRITEELLERKVSAPVYKTDINGRGDSLCWPRDTLYLLNLALTSPTSGGRSVGKVRWRTKSPEFFFVDLWQLKCKSIFLYWR